jgi:hypothetical protein
MEQYGRAVEHCLRRLEIAARGVEHKKYNAWKCVTENVYAALREQEQRLVEYGDSEEERILLEGERRVSRIRQGVIGMYNVNEDEDRLQSSLSTSPSASPSLSPVASPVTSPLSDAVRSQPEPVGDDMHTQAIASVSQVAAVNNRFGDDVERNEHELEVIRLDESESVNTLVFDDDDDEECDEDNSKNSSLLHSGSGRDPEFDRGLEHATLDEPVSSPIPTATTTPRSKRKVDDEESLKKKTPKRIRTSHRLEIKRHAAGHLKSQTTSTTEAATAEAPTKTHAASPTAGTGHPPSHPQACTKPKFQYPQEFQHPQEFPQTSASSRSVTSSSWVTQNMALIYGQEHGQKKHQGAKSTVNAQSEEEEDEEGDGEDGSLQAPARWMWNCRNLREYNNDMGHSSPTYRFSSRKFPRLGRWVNKQRHNRNSLNSYQRGRLDDLSFDWMLDSKETRSWDECFDDLKAYNTEHGTVDVPHLFSSKQYPELGSWVKIQKEAWRNELVRLRGDSPKSTRRLSINKRHCLLDMGMRVEE